MKMLKTSLRERLVFSAQVSSFSQGVKLETWAKKTWMLSKTSWKLVFSVKPLTCAPAVPLGFFYYFDIIFLAD